jgi:adenine/guanine phosphoribosyltransferase-like PRPP-binding protein
MLSPEEITDPYLRALFPVPPKGPGICPVCHSAGSPSGSPCSSCSGNASDLSHTANVVIPISLTQKNGQLYYMLRKYKGSWNESIRNRFTLHMGAFFVRFLRRHGACISEALGGSWDAVTVVPSTSGRPPPHPLAAAIGKSQTLRSDYVDLLELGEDPLDHNEASDQGFRLRPGQDVAGQRLLVVDDTLTTGARAQSAASRLLLEGATGVAVVVVGRIVVPDYSEAANALWEEATAKDFDFDRCCLCDSWEASA